MDTVFAIDNNKIAISTPPLRVLIFRLGFSDYGIDIDKVAALQSYERVQRSNSTSQSSKLPNRSPIPIIDVRRRLGLCTPTYDQLTVVMILELHDRQVGMIVDGVSDIRAFDSDEILPAPRFDAMFPAELTNGFALVDEKGLVLLDIERVIDAEGIPAQTSPEEEIKNSVVELEHRQSVAA